MARSSTFKLKVTGNAGLRSTVWRVIEETEINLHVFLTLELVGKGVLAIFLALPI
jgi:hypothetical protein